MAPANKEEFTQIFNTQTQYTGKSISTFEHAFGKHYMSAGGQDMTHLIASVVNVAEKRGPLRMLDIGAGIGGAALDFAETYGAVVDGLDINASGLERAREECERRNVLRKQQGQPLLEVTFQCLDGNAATFDPETFDVIYTRDTLVHLSATDKDALIAKCYGWLKPGGMLVIADYCLGHLYSSLPEEEQTTPPLSKTFAAYLEARHYHMWTPLVYGQALEAQGFTKVDSQDMAHWYCCTCQTEYDRVSIPKENVPLSEAEIAKLQKTYQDKIQMTLRGDRSYVLVHGTKASKTLGLCQDLVQTYQTMHKDGYIMSCDGNVSARVTMGQEHFLVSPSGIVAVDMEPSQVVLCDGNGKPLEESFLGHTNTHKPTSEVHLHTMIYQSRPDVGAIVHSHGLYSCALACARLDLPPAHYAVCELMHEITSKDTVVENLRSMTVKCSPYHTYGTWDLAVASLAALGQNYACFLASHGAVVVGADLKEAMYRSERLERECQIYIMSKQLLPSPTATLPCLSMHDIQALHERDLTYGQTPPVSETTVETSSEAAAASEEK